MSIRSDYSENDLFRSLSEQASRGVSYLRDLPRKLVLKAEESSAGNQDGFIQNEAIPFSSTFSYAGFSKLFGSNTFVDSSSDHSSRNYFLPLLLLGGVGLGLRFGIPYILSLAKNEALRGFFPTLAAGFGFLGLLAGCSVKKPQPNDFRNGKNIQKFGIESYANPKIENWAGNRKIEPQIAFCPRNTDEVIRIVQAAMNPKKTLGIKGSGHAWGPQVDGDYILSTLNMKKIVVDPSNMTVTTGPGATVAEVDRELRKQNLIVPCDIVGTEDITYGGIMATNSHGSSQRCAPLSDSMLEVEIVTGKGEVKTFKDGVVSAQRYIDALRINMGMFGMMTKFTFKVEKRFNAEGEDFHYPLNELFDHLPDVLRKFDSVEVLWFPGTEKVVLKGWNRVYEPITPEQQRANELVAAERRKNLEYFDSTISKLLSSDSTRNRGLQIIRKLAPSTYPPRSYRISGYEAMHYADARKIPIRELEIGIPFKGPNDLKTVKRAWEAMLVNPMGEEDGVKGADVIVHFRISRGSKVPMSAAYNNELTAWIDYGSYYTVSPQDWNKLVDKIWKRWDTIQKEDGVKFKLHYAKDWPENFDVDARAMFGAAALDEMKAVMQELDPQGLFLNPKMKHRFGF